MKTVRLTLKAARVNAGLDQKTAAEKLGISNKTLSSWEKGKTVPSIPQVEKICALYKVSYDNLIFLPQS